MTKILVKQVGKPWLPPGGKDPLYSIMLEGYGEPQKTFDVKLAHEGEHEAESFTSKSGKTFWRSVDSGAETSVNKGTQTSFNSKTDTDTTRTSIERQQALIQAVAFVNGDMGGDNRIQQVKDAYEVFVELLGE